MVGEMAQLVMALATKPNNLSSIPWSLMVKGGNPSRLPVP